MFAFAKRITCVLCWRPVGVRHSLRYIHYCVVFRDIVGVEMCSSGIVSRVLLRGVCF